MRRIVVLACASAALASCQSVGVHQADSAYGYPACDTAASRDAVARTVHAFFDALAADDYPALQQVTTPSFYAFDVGKRYSARELSEVVRRSHDAGRVINWNVGPITSRIDCSVASAAWENAGSAGTADKVESRAWLESAVLVRNDDRWLIDFLHSTPKDPRP